MYKIKMIYRNAPQLPITADMGFRSRWSIHPNCSPFGRATSHIRRTLYEMPEPIISTKDIVSE